MWIDYSCVLCVPEQSWELCAVNLPHLRLITVMVKTCCTVLALCQFTGNSRAVIHDTDTREIGEMSTGYIIDTDT